MEENNTLQNKAQASPEPIKPPIKPKKSFLKWVLIILIAIIVFSVPIGGYLLLGKMNTSPKPSTVTITTSTPTLTPVPTTNNQKTYLEVPEFGVKIQLSDEIKDAYYVNTTASKGYVYLKVHSLDIEPQCKKDDSSTAALSRVGKDEINPMTNGKYSDSFKGKVIGNYFYYIDLAQYSCAESIEGKANLEKVRSAFTNAQIIQ